MNQLLPLAEFSNYDELRRALREVREKRNISYLVLNSISGAPDRYLEKIIGPNPIRRIGLRSFDWVLGGLGVKCLIVDDPEALARIASRFEPRDAAHLKSALGRWERPADAPTKRSA